MLVDLVVTLAFRRFFVSLLEALRASAIFLVHRLAAVVLPPLKLHGEVVLIAE